MSLRTILLTVSDTYRGYRYRLERIALLLTPNLKPVTNRYSGPASSEVGYVTTYFATAATEARGLDGPRSTQCETVQSSY